jgi:hypothetical protein
LTSTITSVVTDTKMHTAPPSPILATTAFGTRRQTIIEKLPYNYRQESQNEDIPHGLPEPSERSE